MKRRWRVAALIGGLALAAIVTPILYIEAGCRSPLPGMPNDAYRSLLKPAERRAETRTWLTYPEWHIVYSADSLGRYLGAGNPPSGYAYGADIGSFWRSYCAVNRATAVKRGAGDAKVMLYTIGISYSVELAVKAAYERTVGRFAEWASGWTSSDDRYAATVQARYGAFMHETPWHAFPFGQALSGEWWTQESRLTFRHWERRGALTAEYGVKAAYAGLIGWASGATLGRDEPTLRFVAYGTPGDFRAIDARFRPIRAGGGRVVIEALRYAQFTALIEKLPGDTRMIEIAGNQDIFVTALLPANKVPRAHPILSMPLGDRAGWRRIGVTVKVPALLRTIRAVRAAGGEIEHVYDY